jgi:hypothetical protein
MYLWTYEVASRAGTPAALPGVCLGMPDAPGKQLTAFTLKDITT